MIRADQLTQRFKPRVRGGQRLRFEGERFGRRKFTKRPMGAMVRERRARRRAAR